MHIKRQFLLGTALVLLGMSGATSVVAQGTEQNLVLPKTLSPISKTVDTTPPDGGSETVGDNLGDHTATQNLNMSGQDVRNVNQFIGFTASLGDANIVGSLSAGDVTTKKLDLASGRILNLLDPSNDTDAVNYRTLKDMIGAAGDNLGSHIATRIVLLNENGLHTGMITGTDPHGNQIITGGMLIQGETITGLAEPLSPSEAVNKAYVDQLRTDIDMGSVVRTTGNQTIDGTKTFLRTIIARSGLNANNTKLINLADATAPTDAVNLRTLENRIGQAGAGDNLGNHTATTNINVGGNRITNLASPVSNGDAVNKLYVDQLIGSLPEGSIYVAGSGLALSGKTFSVDETVIRTTGDQTLAGTKAFSSEIHALNSNGLRIRNAAANNSSLLRFDGSHLYFMFSDTQTGAWNALRPLYITAANGQVNIGTELSLSGKKIINLATPTAANDAANKAYVDSRIAAAPDTNTTYAAGGGLSLSGTTFAVNGTVVRTTGDQTLAGIKTFSSPIEGSLAVKDTRQIAGSGGADSYIPTPGSIGDKSLMSLFSAGFTGTSWRSAIISKGWTGPGYAAWALSGPASTSSDDRWFLRAGVGNSWGPDREIVHSGNINSFAKSYTAGGGLTLTGTVFAVDSSVVRTSRSITPGDGLTGGGNLSANRSLALAANQIRRNGVTTVPSVMAHNGGTKAAAQFYSGTANPTNNHRMNYDGNFYATRMWSTAYYYFSDERLKKDIQTISPDSGMEMVRNLRPVSYTWKESQQPALGIIAQEVQKVLPTAVIENEGGDLAVDQAQLIAPMLAAMQQIEARVAELETELASTKAELEKALAE